MIIIPDKQKQMYSSEYGFGELGFGTYIYKGYSTIIAFIPDYPIKPTQITNTN